MEILVLNHIGEHFPPKYILVALNEDGAGAKDHLDAFGVCSDLNFVGGNLRANIIGEMMTRVLPGARSLPATCSCSSPARERIIKSPRPASQLCFLTASVV